LITRRPISKGRYGRTQIFHVYKSQYTIVLKILRKLNMIYKKEGAYYTSKTFGENLERIGRLWLEWRAELVD